MTELSADVVVAEAKAGTGLVKTVTGDGLAYGVERGSCLEERRRAVRHPRCPPSLLYHCRSPVSHRESFVRCGGFLSW